MKSQHKYRIKKPCGRFVNAGTGLPSWFTLDQARKLAKSDEMILEFCPLTNEILWEIL
jgi:hypothetical protein